MDKSLHCKFHYLYRVESPSGKYYVGRHSTNDLNDGYLGSGKWVNQYKRREKLRKTILKFVNSLEKLIYEEELLIGSNIDHPLNMNFSNKPIGFATGNRNPNSSECARKKLSERMTGDLNPMKQGHTEEAKKKISAYMSKHNPFKGERHTLESREKMSKSGKVKVFSEAHRRSLSNAINKQISSGARTLPTFKGKKHSDVSLEKIRGSCYNLNRPRSRCSVCGKQVSVNAINRWHNTNCKQIQSL